MDELLKDAKTLLEMDMADNSKDNVLNLYISKAVTMIKSYLNNEKLSDSYIKDKFKDAVLQLVYDGYSIKGEEAVKQKTQGNRNITYKDNLGMNINSVVDLLPLPYAKLR